MNVIVIADIDECKIGLCDKQTTICTNNIGSFVCNCNNGYIPGGNKTLCEGWYAHNCLSNNFNIYFLCFILGILCNNIVIVYRQRFIVYRSHLEFIIVQRVKQTDE